MGQLKIENREWMHERRFWFALDGEVTIETQTTETKQPDLHTSQYWEITRENTSNDKWILRRSNVSQTNDHRGNCLNEYPDTAEEVFCRFTAQIIEYKKPVVFSPHAQELVWERRQKY